MDATHASHPQAWFTLISLPRMPFSQSQPAKASYPTNSISSACCSATSLMQPSLIQTSLLWTPRHLVCLLYQSVCFSDPSHTAAYSGVVGTNSSLCPYISHPSTESALCINDPQQILAELSRCCKMLSRRSTLRKRKSQKLHAIILPLPIF